MSQIDYETAEVKCRCSLNVCDTIKTSLTENQLKIWDTTCFKSWLKVKCPCADTLLIHAISQHEIITHLDPEIHGMTYKVGNVTLRFGPKEFCLITGFRFGNKNVRNINPDFTSLDKSFKHRVLGGRKYKLQQFTTFFNDVLPTLTNDEDVVRLCLLLLVEVGFRGMQLSSPIDEDLVTLLDDLNEWNQFPWGSYLWKYTYRSLHNLFAKKKASQPNKMLNYSIDGFSWAFKMWILEVLPECRHFTKKYRFRVPRCLSWKTCGVFRWPKAKNIMKNASLPRFTPVPLTPNEAEMESDWWLSSVQFIDGLAASNITQVKLEKTENFTEKSKEKSILRPLSVPRAREYDAQAMDKYLLDMINTVARNHSELQSEIKSVLSRLEVIQKTNNVGETSQGNNEILVCVKMEGNNENQEMNVKKRKVGEYEEADHYVSYSMACDNETLARVIKIINDSFLIEI